MNNFFVKTFEIPIYCADVILVIHEDFEEIDEKYKLELQDEFGDSPNNAMAITHVNSDEKGKLEIYILLKPSCLDIDTVAHEILHVINWICVEKGMEHDINNDESLAYLQGYIMGKVGSAIGTYIEKNKIDWRKFLMVK